MPNLWLWLGILVLGVGIGANGMKVYKDNELLQVKLEYSEQVAKAVRARANLVTEYRAKELKWMDAIEHLLELRDKERAANEKTATDLRNTVKRLRNDTISAYATRDAATDTLASCRERATTLGELLGEGVSLATELGIEAEGLASDVRTLKRYTETIHDEQEASEAPQEGSN